MSRLEEIIQESKIEGTKDETPFYFREVDEVDFTWLIQQAGRVEELEEENEALAETRKLDAVENVRLWEENQRYKQAMEQIRKQAECVDELEERNSFLERAHRTNINIAEHALEERDRYKQALEEIVEAKENNYGWEYPDVVDEIATDALAGGTE